MTVLGWDIGGVNTKAARVANGRIAHVVNRPFELQREPRRLAPLLREVAAELGAAAGARHALTMTAELSQMFRTKREGVHFVLDAMEAAFPGTRIETFTTNADFIPLGDARTQPLLVAAANWTATAAIVAIHYPDAILIDVGTTTTDIIPIAGGRIVASGRTDVDRLASGELVYSGALRTPCEAMAATVRVDGREIGVSAEGFALAGDVHRWRGALSDADYTVPTPDGRGTSREFVGERLARVICGDRLQLNERAITEIAEALAAAQVARIADAVHRVHARHPVIRRAVVTGLGAFIAQEAATAAGLDVVALQGELGTAAARCAPAAAVALLLDAHCAAMTS